MKRDNNRIIYVVEDERSAQFRYRVKNVMEALGGFNLKVEWVVKSEIDEVSLDGVDLVVILRQTDKDGVVGRFIDLVHKAGKKVLFDLDDLIFDYRDLLELMRGTGSKNIVYWIGYFWGVRRIARRVDGFLCTNDYLGKKLERSFGKPYKVIRNSLNKEQIAIARDCLSKKKHVGFVVGYFSGSPTHRKDFAMVEPELVEFMERHEDVKMRVVGYMEFSEKMKKWIGAGRVEVIGPVNYLKLQKLVAEVDVSIAPLVLNDFTNCKSELKFFEAGAVETTTIASPTYAYKKAIINGENGFLAKKGEWLKRLDYLYNNMKENERIAKNAREYALKYYYGKELQNEIKEAYEFFSE